MNDTQRNCTHRNLAAIKNHIGPTIRSIIMLSSLLIIGTGCSDSNTSDGNPSESPLPSGPPSPTVNAQEIEELIVTGGFADAATEELYRCLLNQYMTEAGSKRWGDPVVTDRSSTLMLGWCNPLENVANNYCISRSKRSGTPYYRGADNTLLVARKNTQTDPAPINFVGVQLEQYPATGQGDWAMRFDRNLLVTRNNIVTPGKSFELVFDNDVISTEDTSALLNLDQPLDVEPALADDPTDEGQNYYRLEPITLENEQPSADLIEQMLQSPDSFKSISLTRINNLLTQSEAQIRNDEAFMGFCGDAASGGCARGIPLPENRKDEALEAVRTDLNRRSELIETYAAQLHQVLAGKVDFSQCQ